MGMFDYFDPCPPIHCLKCGTGIVEGWKGYHSKQGLLLWRQNHSAPIDQLVDEVCKASEERRKGWRLPPDEGIYIHHGKCSTCGSTCFFRLFLEFTGDTWTGFAEGERVRYGKDLGDGWIQCPDCLDAYESHGGQPMAECEACQLFLILKTTSGT